MMPSIHGKKEREQKEERENKVVTGRVLARVSQYTRCEANEKPNRPDGYGSHTILCCH